MHLTARLSSRPGLLGAFALGAFALLKLIIGVDSASADWLHNRNETVLRHG